MRRRSSGRPRRHGQRSGSSGGPGLGPCTTAPPRTRTVSAGLGEGTWGPTALPAAGVAGHGSAVLCARRVRPHKPSSAPLCCGVMLPSPWAVPGYAGAQWGPLAFPCSRGAGHKLEAVRHGHRSVQGRAWGQPCLAACGDAVAMPPGLQQPGGVRHGLWSRARPLPSLVGVCAAVRPLVPRLGGGSAWPLQLQRGGDCGCVCSWVCMAVPCLVVPCRVPAAAAGGSAMPTAPQPDH